MSAINFPFELAQPFWLLGIPLLASILLILCRYPITFAKPSVWLFLFENDKQEKVHPLKSKKINFWLYFFSLMSFSFLFILLSQPSPLSAIHIFIDNTDIAENMTLKQKKSFFEKLNHLISNKKYKRNIVYLDKNNAPLFYQTLSSNPKLIFSKELNILDFKVKIGDKLIIGMNPNKNRKVSFLPLYTDEDSWSIDQCRYLYNNQYQFLIRKSDHSTVNPDFFVNGQKVKLSEPLNKKNNIVNLSLKSTFNKIELFPKDEFSSNNTLNINKRFPVFIQNNLDLNATLLTYLKGFTSSSKFKKLLITDKYSEWESFNGPAWLFYSKNFTSKINTKKLKDSAPHYLRSNSFLANSIQHSAFNWQIKKRPSLCFENEKVSLFSIGTSSVVRLFNGKYKKIASTISHDSFKTPALQIDFFQILIDETFDNFKEKVIRDIQEPNALQTRIIPFKKENRTPLLWVNILLPLVFIFFAVGYYRSIIKIKRIPSSS